MRRSAFPCSKLLTLIQFNSLSARLDSYERAWKIVSWFSLTHGIDAREKYRNIDRVHMLSFLFHKKKTLNKVRERQWNTNEYETLYASVRKKSNLRNRRSTKIVQCRQDQIFLFLISRKNSKYNAELFWNMKHPIDRLEKIPPCGSRDRFSMLNESMLEENSLILFSQKSMKYLARIVWENKILSHHFFISKILSHLEL